MSEIDIRDPGNAWVIIFWVLKSFENRESGENEIETTLFGFHSSLFRILTSLDGKIGNQIDLLLEQQ